MPIDAERATEPDRSVERQDGITRTITDNATAALFMMDARGHCTFMNPAAVVMSGYTLDEIRDRPLHDAIHHTHPDGRPFPRAECPIDRALPQRHGFRGHQDVFVRKSREFFPVVCAAMPILEGEEPVGTVLEVRDVTAERRAEEALSLHARVLESMREGVSLTGEDGIIVYTNPAEDEMFGYAPGELVGRHVSVQNAYPPDENERIVAEVIEHLRAHGAWSGEWENVRKDGSRFVTHARITRLELSGRPHWLCVQQDITERRRAEEALRALTADLERRVEERTRELEARNAEQEAFVYTVSHDLRAPLLAIQGMSDLLVDAVRANDAADAAFMVERVGRNVRKMSGLLDDLLRLSRVGRSDEQALELDLGEVARGVLADLEPRLAETGGSVSLPDAWPPVLLPRSEAEQLLSNLVGNAVKFAGRPGEPPRVRLSWSGDGERLTVRVEDNGPGVAPQYRERVFGLFQRLDARAEGTGVGLAIVRRIVERHGGRAWVEDSELGGARFAVTVPSA